jgi:hypothetical protein
MASRQCLRCRPIAARNGERFALERVVPVGDRGMITAAGLEQTLAPAGLDWITALRAPAIIRRLAEAGGIRLSLFDQRDLAEIAAPEATCITSSR